MVGIEVFVVLAGVVGAVAFMLAGRLRTASCHGDPAAPLDGSSRTAAACRPLPSQAVSG